MHERVKSGLRLEGGTERVRTTVLSVLFNKHFNLNKHFSLIFHDVNLKLLDLPVLKALYSNFEKEEVLRPHQGLDQE